MLLTTLVLATLMLGVRGVDNCDDRCTSTQACAQNGTCIDTSELIKCGLGISLYYCYKGQECCGYNSCMPEGAVCCSRFFVFCPSGYTCCSILTCCEAGTYCDGKRHCISDNSTQKPTTKRPITPRTLYPTTRARTPYPTTKYPVFQTASTSKFKWWYGVVAAIAVLIFAITIAAAIWTRRHCVPGVPGKSGGRGMVLYAPSRTYGHSPGQNIPKMARNTGVTIHAHAQSPKQDAALLVKGKSIPTQINSKPPKQGTVFVIT